NGPRRNVMRFRVTSKVRDDSTVPRRLATVEPAERRAATVTRTFDFRRTRDAWTINGRSYRPGVPLAEPKLGATEVWRFSSDFHHPVHLHLARFQVLSRGNRGPDVTDAGWKDPVDRRPYELVDVRARFDGFR